MQAVPASEQQPRIVGRYAIYGEIASGGMATVHLGRLVGQVGFSRTVAIKRLHPQFSKDPDFVSMFVDEARLAARIQHPNVVPTLDIVALDDELFLVMEYVQGEALSKLIRSARRANQMVPPRVAMSIIAGALHGLHAAHEAKSERAEPLNIVHRDVSPQNIHVGTDGVARVLDFGVAKAAMRVTTTREGQMKGKISYMAPEQMRGKGVDRRTDLFAAGVVLWEALTSKRLFDGNDPGEILTKLLNEDIPPPSSVEPSLNPELDALVMRALQREPDRRYATAREFAIVLEQSGYVALPREVGEWVASIGGDSLAKRAEQVAEIESVSSHVGPQLGAFAAGMSLPSTTHPPTSRDPTSQVSSPRHSVLSAPSALPSQVTLAVQAENAAKRRSITAALAGVAAALAIALGVMVLVWVNRSPEVGEAVEPVRAEPIATPPPPIEAPVIPEPEVTEAPAVVPDSLPVEVAPPAPPKPTRWVNPTKTKTTPAPAPAPAPTPAKNCNPPTYVDKNGISRIKPECLR